MSDDDKKFVILPEAQADINKILAENPDAAEAFRDLFAIMRQAQHDVETGKYPDHDTAMEALTGQRPKIIDLDDLDGEEKSLPGNQKTS